MDFDGVSVDRNGGTLEPGSVSSRPDGVEGSNFDFIGVKVVNGGKGVGVVIGSI